MASWRRWGITLQFPLKIWLRFFSGNNLELMIMTKDCSEHFTCFLFSSSSTSEMYNDYEGNIMVINDRIIYSRTLTRLWARSVTNGNSFQSKPTNQAQFEYCYQVCLWDSQGVPFRTHMYVPEIHPITGREFHEREDFAHMLKVNIVLHMQLTI